jgi:hypothetical protein
VFQGLQALRQRHVDLLRVQSLSRDGLDGQAGTWAVQPPTFYDPIEVEDDDSGTATPHARLEDAC